jgi:hypothetical protein
MPVPTLLHPVPVGIEVLDTSGATWDAEAREPIHGSRTGTAVVINAQVGWDLEKNPKDHPAGVAEISTGYILLRKVDMVAKSLTPKHGDRIASIGGDAVDYYITGPKPMAHWPDQGGWTMKRFYFGDRQPVRSAS